MANQNPGFSDDELRLAKFFIEREGEGVLTELRDLEFYAAGILDSLDMVSLAVFVERQFGKKLDLMDPKTMGLMGRFETLMSLINKLEATILKTSPDRIWQVVFFEENGVYYHLALHHHDFGYADLSLLGARMFSKENPLFPRGEIHIYNVELANTERMIAFIAEPNLLCASIIEQEKNQVGWHLSPEAPDFILSLRNNRSKNPQDMNCVEWVVYALELAGLELPEDILTISRFRQWLEVRPRNNDVP